MNFNFGRKKKKTEQAVMQTAVSSGYSESLFSYFGSHNAYNGCERQLYRSLRENIPIIDAAVYKIIR